MRAETSEVAKQLGQRIRNLRSALSYTQEELAELAEISVSFLSMIERGERFPHINTLAAVADALGVTLSQIVLGVNESQLNGRRVTLLPLIAYLENLNLGSSDVAALLLLAQTMFKEKAEQKASGGFPD